jgi:hypothetical protein
MINNILNKIKPIINKLYKQSIETCSYINKKIKPLSKLTLKKSKKNFKNISSIVTEQWKILGLGLSIFVFIYYGLGAAISSKFNNSLDNEIKITQTSPTYLGNTLSHILKSQIDDAAWTPSLPAFFPASVLDNLPNFQLGVKNSLNYIIKKLAHHHKNIHLKEAAQLLDYPADIWLFSQTNDKLSPGSAKQYRKAISHIVEFSSEKRQTNIDDLLVSLNILNKLLQKQIKTLEKQIQEYNSDYWDFSSDNLFYQAQGNAYTSHYILNALQKDYQETIVNSDQYENLTTALMLLGKAVHLNPTIVKNSSLKNVYSANHLMYLAYFMSQAQNYIQQIYYNIKRIEGNTENAN